MKEKIKKIKFIGKFLLILKSYSLFNYDRKFFVNNFINGTTTNETLNYDLILEIHKLEKGMTSKQIRPFGVDKVKKIIKLLNLYQKKGYEESFASNLAISILCKYKEIYKENNWIDKSEYILVSNYLNSHKNNFKISSGAYEIKFDDIKKSLNLDYFSFLKSRHSVRNYSREKLKQEDIEKACEMAILSPSACNRQMCKLYYIQKEENKKLIEKYTQGLSLFDLTNANYFIITFDVNSFYFLGERNQGWLNSGLFCMNFVNALHSLGIGSCIAQFANSPKEEKILKDKLSISKSERIAVIVVCGYYDNSSKIPVSSRKDKEEILNYR